MKHTWLILIGVILLAACQTTTAEPVVPLPDQTPPATSQALLDMTNFFVYLNHGKYEEAAALYGGSYEILQGYNPDLDPKDKAGLLKNGCEINGIQCLQLYSADLTGQPSETEFVYTVTYRNPDDTQFVRGPCCGATEEEMPPVTEFEVHITCTEGGTCQILDLPPYVP
jgi:hypothetical protein